MLVVLVVLMIIVIFSMANVRIVAELWDELRLVEHKQQMHWQTAGTNAPANVTKPDYPVDQAEARVGGSRS